MAKSYSCRPSDLLDLQDPYDRFSFDRAVWHFGTALTSELNSVKGKTDREIERKQDRILKKWIPESAPNAKQFREPPKGETL